jgi:hypothetical protein
MERSLETLDFVNFSVFHTYLHRPKSHDTIEGIGLERSTVKS